MFKYSQPLYGITPNFFDVCQKESVQIDNLA